MQHDKPENDTARVNLQTRLMHEPRHDKGAISPPIYQSSLFSFSDYDTMIERFRGESDHPLYSRMDNPTVRVFQEKMAALEGGEACVAFSSGMAAISGTILSVVRPGDKIVCVKHIYPDAYRFMRGFCHDFSVETVFVDGESLEAIDEALNGARLLYLESPSSWVMTEQNLTAIAKLAKAKGVTTVIDNSWASPMYQKPLAAGIDIVVHSASKYISGHSDVVAGVAIGSRQHISAITRTISPFLGGKLSANEAWLLLRGLRTLPFRMRQHCESALELARRLSEHPQVLTVNHPGLAPSDISSLTGYSGLFSFELAEAVDIPRFCNQLQLFSMGVSWGGFESLVMPAISVLNQAGEFNSAIDFGISPRLIRISIGLEDTDDLWHDLQQAIAGALG
ncbi:aminotransferase class I/II-fold pyridoxal phosphate-dependent enzyme [Brenneria goodwinii]|uniref:Cystathionine gamma-synthase n=1 Tax=Brenneria goodwinii TaxID=1109412 RepID=A0A0G4JWN1_9GAMM|nr:aminotransferase class I/II-fold pyridoxal phosphate-dependent enzyme [Brenneria goodwinii]MCG8158014.1 aminotransferase class I/II-fold pyridoxal phosphate-dependent enzyme [Brenneria goodwinii]MCG8161270.1 aminotransferase class I/II-fold pyridoxal phosphate-dependent enzyme [Brenneria goodwinii]MCG8165380.1 aminotransferase class I/II-fold pyridoxal phosphate-dependent enzyme [Brenneria goodwinii]MCG8171333.1 aminotransferase class I/II-fold pyridoxal phosphate-dependent enzyme [Brenneria